MHGLKTVAVQSGHGMSGGWHSCGIGEWPQSVSPLTTLIHGYGQFGNLVPHLTGASTIVLPQGQTRSFESLSRQGGHFPAWHFLLHLCIPHESVRLQSFKQMWIGSIVDSSAKSLTLIFIVLRLLSAKGLPAQHLSVHLCLLQDIRDSHLRLHLA